MYIKNLINICSLIYGTFWAFSIQAQTSNRPDTIMQEEIKPLQIAQSLPADFWTREHLFYIDGDTIRKNLSEYKGKLIVIDFWATWCAICLAQMKDKQTLFAKYPNETAFLLVNPSATKDNYNSILEKQNKISGLSVAGKVESIIEDGYLHALFPTNSYPRYVWISPRGNLVALTMALSVTEGHLKSMIDVFAELNESYREKE